MGFYYAVISKQLIGINSGPYGMKFSIEFGLHFEVNAISNRIYSRNPGITHFWRMPNSS